MTLGNGRPSTGTCAVAIVVVLLAGALSATADDNADARFQGSGRADPIRIENVTCKAAGVAGAGCVTVDLAWDHSWRAAWEVASEQHGGTRTLALENWDAAWVFVKFRKPGDDCWSHATLSTNAADHSVPAGAKLDIGLTDDGQRGLGVFVYRNAPGSGPNEFRAMKLRWLHGADGVENIDQVTVAVDRVSGVRRDADGAPKLRIDRPSIPGGDALDKILEEADTVPAAEPGANTVEIRVFAIEMVYVPQCAFWLGDGSTDRNAAQFSAGDTTDPLRIESEEAVTLGGKARNNLGNQDAIGMFRIGDDFNSGFSRTLPTSFPKGYAAFYCMKREMTRRAYAAFFQTLSAAQQSRLYSGGEVGTDPHTGCNKAGWSGNLAYAAWAGLRPMTEMEYEKACRGPLKPVPGEYAWGTSEARAKDAQAEPAAASRSARVAARASYWGILSLGGTLNEYTVAVGNEAGRRFAGTHGDGSVAMPAGVRQGDEYFGTFGDLSVIQPAGWYFHETGFGFGIRGETVSSRSYASSHHVGAVSRDNRESGTSFFCVRTAAPSTAPRGSLAHEDILCKELPPQSLFNERMRIENVAIVSRAAKTATVEFDIAWPESWRNAKNHDAAWVFFKVRPKGARNWQHARLAADKVLNPTGYRQDEGTPVDLIVPAGDDGFTGMFVQRASEGRGSLSARGVTAVLDFAASQGVTKDTDIDIHAFGIEMVYVPEGPFHLGSGGTEASRFYKYTDGSQNGLPYRVAGPGAIPTGPQEGRLWATGIAPDGTDAGEIPASFPNGYAAFYCMKYAVKQGQFTAFLGMQSGIKSIYHEYRGGDWPVLRRTAYEGTSLSWGYGASFGAWAGLRPMTELEYEKACRGPREPVPNELGPGYWGIPYLTAGEMSEHVVSVGHPTGRQFKGTHGTGIAALPKDWPPLDATGVANRGANLRVNHNSRISDRRAPRDTSMRGHHRLAGNQNFTGWRGVRAAPSPAGTQAGDRPKPRGDFKLELDPLPDLRQPDISLFYLSGRVRNGGDKPLTVEVAWPLPDACFPGGAASRTFTANPKTAMPFKVLTVLTRKTARTSRRGQMLTVRIQSPGGDVLVERDIRLPLIDPGEVAPPVVGSLDGGALTLLVANFTDRAHAVMIEMLPAGIQMPEKSRRVNIEAQAEVRSSFPISGDQVFVDPGFHRIPYRVAVAESPPQGGDAFVELRVQSRWRVGQQEIRSEAEKAATDASLDDEQPDDLGGLLGELDEAGLAAKRDKTWDPPADLFNTGKPPDSWKPVKHGASVWLGRLKPLPKKNTLVQAATTAIAPADREVVIKVASESEGWTWLDEALIESCGAGSGPATKPFVGRIWLNGEVVYDSRPSAERFRKPVRIRKGNNKLLVQCRANADDTSTLANVFVLFHDAQNGERIKNLVLDVQGVTGKSVH